MFPPSREQALGASPVERAARWYVINRGRLNGNAQYVTGFDQRKVVLTGAMSIRSSATAAERKARPP